MTLWKAPMTTVPVTSPWRATRARRASVSSDSMRSAASTRIRPAGVSTEPPGCRSRTVIPVSSSSFATCCEIADG